MSLALSRDLFSLPDEGRIGVFLPPAGYDLSDLPQERVDVVQPFRPDHDDAATRGYVTAPAASGPCAIAIVILPQSKDAARAAIAAARAVTEGLLIVDGQKTAGVDSLLREIKSRAEVGEVLAKAHGKIFAVHGGDFADWALTPRVIDGFHVPPGGFSAAGPDPASVALAMALPERIGGRVADLGAGWGFLASAILQHSDVKELHLVEADHVALDCARRNVTDPRAHFHWADATQFMPPAALDAVVTNPPFHHGRRADPSLGRAFITAAGGMLKPSGKLWLVANRHLPYEETLRDIFDEVREVGGDGAFKIIAAARPRRPRR